MIYQFWAVPVSLAFDLGGMLAVRTLSNNQGQPACLIFLKDCSVLPDMWLTLGIYSVRLSKPDLDKSNPEFKAIAKKKTT